jgi:hypothetical protein
VICYFYEVMILITCEKCHKQFDEELIVQTDEFKEEGEIKNYCSTCFVEGAKNGFGHYDIGRCEVCNSPLVLQYDEEETVELVKFDGTVHYICSKVRDALEKDASEEEMQKLEEEEHEYLIVYAIEPEEDNFSDEE